MGKSYLKWSKFHLLLMVICIGIVIVGGCSTGNEAQNGNVLADGTSEANLSMGTQPAGVFFHVIGTEFSKLVGDNSSVSLTVKPFSGADAWLPLLNAGDIDFGIDAFHTIRWAYKGEHHFDQQKNIRTLVNGGGDLIAGIVVRDDSEITKISDLKGKKLTSEFPANLSTKLVVEAHLMSGGLDWDDIKSVPVATTADSINALREGRVDAAFAGVPINGIFTEVDNAIGIRELNWADLPPERIDDFPQDIKDRIDDLLPGMSPGVYKGEGFIKADSATLLNSPHVVVVGAHISDEVVYNVMETLWEHHEKWKGMRLEEWSLEVLSNVDRAAAPFHNGVVQFFKDKGIWTDEAEQMQQELLNSIN